MPLSDQGNTWLALIGWTLIHFFWQGLLVLGVCMVWLRLWSRRPPSWRYTLSLGALLLLALAPVATIAYFRAIEQRALSIPVRNVDNMQTSEVAPIGNLHDRRPVLESPYIKPSPVAATAAGLVAPMIPVLTAIWMVGLLGLGLWQLLVYGVAQRAVTRSYSPLPELESTISRLATGLGIRKRIRIGGSSIVNSPATLGFFDPVILLPTTMMTGLRRDQVELLLLHELAHIRRNDYLVNLIQTAIEAVLFWHPAVWYLSKRVRIEREHCCDEMATASSGEVIEYARTLTLFEKLRQQVPSLSQGLAGGSLKDRIQRLLQQKSEHLGPRGTAIPLLLLGVTLTVALLAAPALASIVGDLRILYELTHSNFTEQVYGTLGKTNGSNESALHALSGMIALAKDNEEPSYEQLCAFAESWERNSNPDTLRALVLEGATQVDVARWRQEGGFPYGSQTQVSRLCSQLWVAAQEHATSDPEMASTCARAAILLASQEPFKVATQARRLLIEIRFAEIAQVDAAQQRRLWRVLGHVNGVNDVVYPQTLEIGAILDREDRDGKQLTIGDARNLRACIERMLRYTPHRPDISAMTASIARRLRVRLASTPELAAQIDAAINHPSADPLFRAWARPLPPGEKDPFNVIGISSQERDKSREPIILPMPPTTQPAGS